MEVIVLPAIHIAVIDPITLKLWGTPHYSNGNPINTQHCYGQFNGHPSLCPGATNLERQIRRNVYFSTL